MRWLILCVLLASSRASLYVAVLRVSCEMQRDVCFSFLGYTPRYRTGSKYWTALNLDRLPRNLKSIPSRPEISDPKIQYFEPVRYLAHSQACRTSDDRRVHPQAVTDTSKQGTAYISAHEQSTTWHSCLYDVKVSLLSVKVNSCVQVSNDGCRVSVEPQWA